MTTCNLAAGASEEMAGKCDNNLATDVGSQELTATNSSAAPSAVTAAL